MAEIFLGIGVSIVAALLLMISHECFKVLVYVIKQKLSPGTSTKVAAPWKVWRYVDPVGLIVAMTSSVPFSRPYFFRIRDKRTNLLLGLSGLFFLAAVFFFSVYILRVEYGGAYGLLLSDFESLRRKAGRFFWQDTALYSFGMLAANLFPISTFDMGLLLAGISSRAYMGIIRADGLIKVIFLITLFLGLIPYGATRVILILYRM